MYLDAIKSFPSIQHKLYTEKGTAFHIKTDIFKRVMVYMYEGGGSGMISLSPERVAEIREMNIKKEKPKDLIDFTKQEVVVVESEYANVDEQDNLDRFDNTFKKGGKKKRKPARSQAAKGKKVVDGAKEEINTATTPKPAQKKAKPKPRPKPKPKTDGEGDKTVKPIIPIEGNKPVISATKDGETGASAPKKNKRRRPPRKDGPKNEDKPKTNE